MAISKNIWLKGAKQKLGGVVLYQAMGETRMRELAPAVTNPRTPAQMTQRVRMANVVAMYKVSAKWMRGAFEDKPQNQSDYNAFVAANLSTSMVAQTKAQAAANAAVVAPYKVSSGSLNPVSWSSTTTALPISDLFLGDLTIGQTTTVGQFAAALEANNNLEEYMQLSFIQYIQQTDDNGTPYVICRPYEVILNSSSTQLLNAYMPLDILKSSGGQNNAIAVDTSGFTGGFAVILSKTNGSRINVSPAYIILTNDNDLYATYCIPAAWSAAIESYGEGQDIFLSSDSANQASTGIAVNPTVLGLQIGSRFLTPGDEWPTRIGADETVNVVMSQTVVPTDGNFITLTWSDSTTRFYFTLASTPTQPTSIVSYSHPSGDFELAYPSTGVRLMTLGIDIGDSSYELHYKQTAGEDELG